MRNPSRLLAAAALLLAAETHASQADAERIQKTWQLNVENWSLETRAATTPEARAAAIAKRPDPVPFARDMWQQIGSQLDQQWILGPAAWFLRVAPALRTTKPDGSSTATFGTEIDALLKAIETRHLKSPGMIPVCMALTNIRDPRALVLLEKIQASHPETKTQGVAALASALVLKTLGDDQEIIRKRLTLLRKAIIDSSDIDLGGGVTVAKLAEDELYIIRYLTKGRVAPDLSGIDSAGRPIKLSDFKDRVIVLLFWHSAMPEADRTIEITAELVKKHADKPLTVVGVNRDPLQKLRSLEADGTVSWRNFSDAPNQLAREYRVASWPLVYVLDGERKIHFAGTPGSFVELTAEALLAEIKPAAAK
jgi:peroxiredoxin